MSIPNQSARLLSSLATQSGRMTTPHCSSPLLTLPRSQPILALEFYFYSFASAATGGIADLRRFAAIGKEAEVSAELTAFAGSGRQLGSEGFAPVVTVKESHGGRGYAYQTYASYKPTGSKLKRLELE